MPPKRELMTTPKGGVRSFLEIMGGTKRVAAILADANIPTPVSSIRSWCRINAMPIIQYDILSAIAGPNDTPLVDEEKKGKLECIEIFHKKELVMRIELGHFGQARFKRRKKL